VIVFVTSRMRPIGPLWLAPLIAALDDDPTVAGACSRVSAYPEADLLARRDGDREPSGSADRAVKRIDDWAAYRHLGVDERAQLTGFHVVSAAVRASVLRRIPLRAVTAIGEERQWAREVLEAGLAIVHEPASRVSHYHDYSLYERFMRSVDDGVSGRENVGREVPLAAVDQQIRQLVADDWRFLREREDLSPEEIEHWQIEALLRRVAEACGRWLGANHAEFPPEVLDAFSRIAAQRRGTLPLR
jgi:rhamnosyltransferase